MAFLIAMMMISFNSITPLPVPTAAWADKGLAPVINELYVDSGELPTVEELLAKGLDAEDQLVGVGGTIPFQTANASGWASGSIFVFTITGENSQLVVLEWNEDEKELRYSLWSGSISTMEPLIQNDSLKDAVKEFKVKMLDHHHHQLPSEWLDKWAESFTPK